MTGLLSSIIDLIIASVCAPVWFSTLDNGETDPYVFFFRMIYPRWLSLKRGAKRLFFIKRKVLVIKRERRQTLKALGWRRVTI